jgi:hypothetical protein
MFTRLRRWGMVVALALTVGFSSGFGGMSSLIVPLSQPCKESCAGTPRKHCDAGTSDDRAQPGKQCGW